MTAGHGGTPDHLRTATGRGPVQSPPGLLSLDRTPTVDHACECGCGELVPRRFARGHNRRGVDPIERFWSKTAPQATGCITWIGPTDGCGYGLFSFQLRSVRAHRFAWELVNGPISEGLVIDHLCRVRGCVNVAHMELVTPAENSLRGFGPLAVNARKTHCNRGHEFTDDNTSITPTGSRRCRTCKNLREREARRAA